jgi:hypothetical protein
MPQNYPQVALLNEWSDGRSDQKAILAYSLIFLNWRFFNERQNILSPNTGNRILRPNNQEKRAVRIVQRPPSEANIARTVCDLNSSVTTKPCPLGEMPQPGYKRAVI